MRNHNGRAPTSTGTTTVDHDSDIAENLMDELVWRPLFQWTYKYHNNSVNCGSEFDEHESPFLYYHPASMPSRRKNRNENETDRGCGTNVTFSAPYFYEYKRRHIIDQSALRLLHGMAKELNLVLHLHHDRRRYSHTRAGDSDDDAIGDKETDQSSTNAGPPLERLDESYYNHMIGRSWEHRNWNAILAFRLDIMDQLQKKAQHYLPLIQRQKPQEGPNGSLSSGPIFRHSSETILATDVVLIRKAAAMHFVSVNHSIVTRG